MKMLGTFSGVFVPSFEAILGAVLFLILPLLVGAMGMWNMVIIVILANTATLATAFSIADCATNLERIGAGGMYAVAKRSLGKAFGGSIGIQLFLAQAASIGFYCIGFADPLQKILFNMPFFSAIAEHAELSVLMQKQIIATVIAVVAFIAGLAGADFIVNIQMVIFVILALSVLAILGSPLFGFESGGIPIFMKSPNLTGGGLSLGFWGAFAAFFPAVTGIDAGVGMSGQLKDTRKSLSKGTFTAIGITAVVYIGVTIVFGFIRPELLQMKDGQIPTSVDVFAEAPVIPVILLLGILFATGSSALSYFMTSPRTAQALARDKILPGFLSFLRLDFKRGGKEPRWATVAAFCVVLPVIWAGDVTSASLIVGICFLSVYGWVNLSAFLERVSGNPSFRPTSKGHWAISLYGFVICMVVIALFNPYIGIGIIASQFILFYLLLKYRSSGKLEGVWWGVVFSVLNWGFKKMRTIIQGSKNWRPVVGVFCFADRPEESQRTLEMGIKIADYKGITMVNVLKPKKVEAPLFPVPDNARIVLSSGEDFNQTILSIAQAAAPGGFQMNSVILPIDSRVNLIALIGELIELKKNVLLYRHGWESNPDIKRIDVWWKGEENGNLMALLAFIINQSEQIAGREKYDIRFIRKLMPNEDRTAAEQEIQELMRGARLGGEVILVPADEESIHDTIRNISKDSSLILIGMPGTRAGGIARLFSLDKVFFTRELSRFDDFPPLLFVKAAETVDLLE